MILDGCHFIYGAFDSKNYGVYFAHLDTSEYMSLSGEIEPSYLFNRRNKKAYVIGDDYENSTVSFDAEIISDDVEVISKQNRRVIEKALFNRPKFQKLSVYQDEDCLEESYEIVDGVVKSFYLMCRFINPEKIEDDSGGVVGYKFTVECDSNLMWQESSSKTFSLTGNQSNITVVLDTDDVDYTYPKVTIQMGTSGGDITIINSTDSTSRITKFTGLSPSISLVMNGNTNYISGDNNYDKFSNQNFVRLLDGDNNLVVAGNITSIKFEWNNKRFL